MTAEEVASKLAIEFLRREKMQMYQDEFLEKYIELKNYFEKGLKTNGMRSKSGFEAK
ncbi:hypothetical protein [Xenorhabdus sp. SGI246]|uniref:hypothetical protein n=1 Tax=Xenorhabdus sp. SGI246 TaxID=3158263 RepID=UPI00349F2573